MVVVSAQIINSIPPITIVSAIKSIIYAPTILYKQLKINEISRIYI